MLTPTTIVALLITLVLLFSFKGEIIIGNPLTIVWIAVPLFIQAMLIFWLGYGLARLMMLHYDEAAPASIIGASNHFEVAIATSTMLFGLSSGAALATVVGVLIKYARWMDRHFTFKVLHAGKVLPIRIFRPTDNNILVTEVVGVF